MTDSIDDRLRESLASLSRPVETGEAPSLVDRALAEVESGQSRTKAHGPSDAMRKPWHRRIPGGLAALVLASFAIVITIPVLTTTLSGSRSAARKLDTFTDERSADSSASVLLFEQDSVRSDALAERLARDVSDEPSARVNVDAGAPVAAPAPMAAMAKSGDRKVTPQLADQADPVYPYGTVIQILQIRLTVPDVPDAVHRVEELVRIESGEMVEEAAIDFESDHPAGVVSLRVYSTNVDSLVTKLMDIGSVRTVSKQRTDVREQLESLDARNRSEYRVELELMEVLAAHPEAPIAELIPLRRELAEVRASRAEIEQRRNALIGQVTYSTIRVKVTSEVDEPKSAHTREAGLAARTRNAIADGWRACTDSLVWVVQVLVSGLVWWLAAAVLIWLAVRHHRWTSSWR